MQTSTGSPAMQPIANVAAQAAARATDKYSKAAKRLLDEEHKSLCIHFAQVKDALELIERAHENRSKTTSRRGVMIVGPSRSGKTKIIDIYQDRYPEDTVDGKKRRRVLKLHFSDAASIPQVMYELLVQLGDPIPEKGTASQRRDRFKKLLEALGVEVILFDEAHHLVDGRQDSVAIAISKWLKTLTSVHKIAVVLAGPEPVLRTIQLNEEVKNRFYSPVFLHGLGDAVTNTGDGPQRIVANGFLRGALKKIQEHFSVTRGFDLSKLEMSDRFSLATGGLIGLVVELVVQAGEFAIEGQRDTITVDDLARAYDLQIGDEIPGGIGNPFSADIKLVNKACRAGWSRKVNSTPGTNGRIKAKKRQPTVGDVLQKGRH